MTTNILNNNFKNSCYDLPRHFGEIRIKGEGALIGMTLTIEMCTHACGAVGKRRGGWIKVTTRCL